MAASTQSQALSAILLLYEHVRHPDSSETDGARGRRDDDDSHARAEPAEHGDARRALIPADRLRTMRASAASAPRGVQRTTLGFQRRSPSHCRLVTYT